jgi:hypothetical protein
MSNRADHESRAFALLVVANPARVEDVRRELSEPRLAAICAQARAMVDHPPRVGVDRRWPTGRASRLPGEARRLRLLGASAVALTVALAGFFAVLSGGGEPARAQRVLNAAATIAAAQPASAPGRGDYTYAKQRRGVIGGPSETVEWWSASDGSGRMRRTGPTAIGVWSSPDGGPRLRAAIEGRNRAVRDATFGPGGFAAVYQKVNPSLLHGRLDDLPTDSKALDALLRRKLREAVDFNSDPDTQNLQMLQLIEEILANPLASPKLRGAAYKIAAELEGVEISEHLTDPIGRPATAIALCSTAIPARYEVFFDPATSATLGTREFDSGTCDQEAPSHVSSKTIAYNVYLEQMTVHSVGRRG